MFVYDVVVWNDHVPLDEKEWNEIEKWLTDYSLSAITFKLIEE